MHKDRSYSLFFFILERKVDNIHNFFQSFLSYFSCDDGNDPDTNCRKTHCVCKNGGTCEKPGYPCRYKIIKQNENEINHLSLHLPFSSLPRYFYSFVSGPYLM